MAVGGMQSAWFSCKSLILGLKSSSSAATTATFEMYSWSRLRFQNRHQLVGRVSRKQRVHDCSSATVDELPLAVAAP